MDNKEVSADYRFVIEIWNQNYKKFLLISLAISLIVLIFSTFIEDVYQSQAKLSRSSVVSYFKFDEESSGSLGGVSDFLTGSKEPTLTIDETALEFLSSKQYVLDFLKKNNFEPSLLAAKKYNSNADSIIIDSDIYDSETESFKSSYFQDRASLEEALYAQFDENFTLTKKPGSIYIFKYSHISPSFSKEVLETLIDDVNSFLQVRELERSKKRSTFLSERLSENTISSIQLNLSSMLSKELQKQVYLETAESFVFEIIDPARTSLTPIYPKRVILALFSFFFSVLMLFIYRLFRS